jgi:hypothetical protein
MEDLLTLILMRVFKEVLYGWGKMGKEVPRFPMIDLCDSQ